MVRYRSIWKLQIPNKIKIFLWLMLKNSILTKDNLTRRGWTGNDECHFCGAKESIDHLFFGCAVAKLVWQVVTCAMGIANIPRKLSDLVGPWLRSFPAEQRKMILGGEVTICWTIWKARNRACFDKKNPDDPTVLVYRLCHYLNSWSILQKPQDRGKTEEGVKLIKKVLEEVYARSLGWNPFARRLGVG